MIATPVLAASRVEPGFFTGKPGPSGGYDRVFPGGVPATEDKAAFIAFIEQHLRSGDEQHKSGAAFIIFSMIGYSNHLNGRVPSAAEITEWKKRINNKNIVMNVQTASYASNSAWNDQTRDNHMYLDDHRYDKAIVFWHKLPNGALETAYVVKIYCGNPLGGLSLPAAEDDWELKGLSSVRGAGGSHGPGPVSVKPGDSVEFSHAITNTGTVAVGGFPWKVMWSGVNSGQAEAGYVKKDDKIDKGQKRIMSTYGYIIPADAKKGNKFCQRIEGFPKSSDDGSSGASNIVCAVVGDIPTSTPGNPDQFGDIWTKFDYYGKTDGDPIAAGEVGPFTHYAKDTHKIYKGPMGKCNDRSPLLPALATEWFDYIDWRFYHEGRFPYTLDSKEISQSPYKIDRDGTPIDGGKFFETEFKAKQEDVRNKFVQRFEFDLYVHKYRWNPESQCSCGSYVDDDGVTQTLYCPYYSISAEPIYKIYTKGSAPDDFDVGKKPKVQIWGGDARVGGSVITSLSDPKFDDGLAGKAFGSWVEYGGMIGGTINMSTNTGFATASFIANTPDGQAEQSASSAWQDLTFSNRDGFGHFTLGSRFLAQSLVDNRPIETSPLCSRSGVYEASSIGNMTIGRAVSCIIKTSGTFTINGNITYASGMHPDEVPQLVIVAEGGIDITSGVTNVDAWLITNGQVDTCSDGPEIGENAISPCDAKLTINGPVSAATLNLKRTAGSEGQSPESVQEPAEIFNLRPDTYTWARRHATSAGRVQTVNQMELPPRY